jgi:antitoxin CptB
MTVVLMDKPRLRWACRRGMLELDRLLQPFVEQGYDLLSELEKAHFETLLACSDPQIFAWFMRSEHCMDANLESLINKIRNQALV